MKYAIVTGASPCSIGFIAAKKLASPEFGYKVILACRNSEKGYDAESLIRSAYPSSEVEYLHLDLSSFDSIRKFVDEVHALDGGTIVDPTKLGSLNILVNNAGIGWGKDTPFIETSNGLEEIVGVNHFGTFLLTQLLLEDLKRADAGSRVVIVSSSLHEKNERTSKMTKSSATTSDSKGQDDKDDVTDDVSKEKLVLPNFPEEILQTKEDYDGFKAYQVSKLCNLWYAYELQRRLDEEAGAAAAAEGSDNTTSTTTTTKSSVRINSISPGFIPTTGLTRRSGNFGIFFMRYILDPFRHIGMGVTRSPEEGAEVIVQASTLEVASTGGQYFALPKGKETVIPIASSEESLDETKAKELWELSLKTCNLEA